MKKIRYFLLVKIILSVSYLFSQVTAPTYEIDGNLRVYENINVRNAPVDTLVSTDSVLFISGGWLQNVPASAFKYDMQKFNGNFTIRSDIDGIGGENYGGVTLGEWIINTFSSKPTITIDKSPTTTYYTNGTKNTITLSGATSGSTGFTMSDGEILETLHILSIYAFGEALTYTTPFVFYPLGVTDYMEVNYTFYTKQKYTSTSPPFGTGWVTSSTISVYGVYPTLTLEKSVDYSTDLTGFYADVTINGSIKPVADGGTTVTFNNNALTDYFYIAIPTSYGPIKKIYDKNDFDVTEEYTEYGPLSLPSTTLTPWTVNYYIYKSTNYWNTEGVTWTYTIIN